MLSSQRQRAETFWNWWLQHTGEAVREGGLDDSMLDEAVQLLHEYDDALGLEVHSEARDAGELIITAYGDPDHLQSVLDLVATMPRLPGWHVAGPRPAASETRFELNLEGWRFDSTKILFEPLTDPNDPEPFGLEIYFMDVVGIPEDLQRVAAALVVQTVIGERSFIENIAELRLGGDGSTKAEDLIPVSELREFMKWRGKKKLRE